MSMFPAYLNTFLGAVVFVCAIAAVLHYQDELDALDRFILAGIAGSMLIVTPALWDSHSPFEGWSFNLSRAFLAAYFLKRFAVPVVWKWRAKPRQDGQISQSTARLVDKMHHKL
jgi:hypothetical protein